MAESLPMIGCMLLTRNRPDFLRRAIASYRAQTYPLHRRRLLILDSGDSAPLALAGLLNTYAETRIVTTHLKLPIGALRNMACEYATECDVISHMDDDDHYAPTYLESQVSRLLKSGKQLVGFHSALFYRPADGKWFKFTGAPQYSMGATFVYYRSWWAKHPFPHAKFEDRPFVDQAALAHQLESADAGDLFYATIHPGNTMPKRVTDSNWRETGDSKGMFPAAFAIDAAPVVSAA